MTFKISKKNPLLFLYVGGALLIVLAVWLWFAKACVDPERVFWGTIDRSLSTSSVTVHAQQTNSGTDVKQTIRYSLGADNRSHSLTTLSQRGTVVTNETIGTPDVDYTRYVSIKTDQKKADGTPLDTSKLIGVWAKGQQGSGQFFSQAVFGSSLPVGGLGVPIGNLSPEVRGKLVKQIRGDDVYGVSFAKTKKEHSKGRLVYTYEATIKPVAYISLMKEFAKNIGLHNLDNLDPSRYKDQKPFKLLITVDARARQLVGLKVPDTGSKQTYSAFGVPVQIDLPKNTITGADLQKLLSDLQ